MTMYSPMTFPMHFLLLTAAATLLNGSPTNQVSSTKLPGHHSGELGGKIPKNPFAHPSSEENPTKLHDGHSGQTSAENPSKPRGNHGGQNSVENPVAPSARSSGQKSGENPVKPYGSHSGQTSSEIPTNPSVHSSGEKLAKPPGGDSGQTSSEYPQEPAGSSTNGECTCAVSLAQPAEKYPAPKGEGVAIPTNPLSHSSGEHSGKSLAKLSAGDDSGQTRSEYPQEPKKSSSMNGECKCAMSPAQHAEKYPAPTSESDAIPAIPEMPLPVSPPPQIPLGISPPDAISCNPLQPGLLFAPPDWDQRPTCFYNHTCVQAACTLPSEIGASEAYWEVCPLTNAQMWVYLSVYNISSLTLSDKFSADFTILRNESDFAYLEKQCTTSPAWQGNDTTKPSRFATVAYWNEAPVVVGVARRIQLPLKVLDQDAYHFTATGFHDKSGSYAYAKNDANDPTALLTFAKFSASVSRMFGMVRAA